MHEFALSWYNTLNSFYVLLTVPMGGLTSGTGGSVITALLLGILGAASPCQLSTNASSIAYVLRAADRSSRLPWSAVAYVVGKVLIYTGMGVLAVLMGQGLRAVAIPTIVITRKILGPMMILIGLALLGVLRPRMGLGHGLSLRLQGRVGESGIAGAFLLGVAFSFAFCPTLALLFFGYVIPSAVTSAGGPFYPAAFAVGTTLPLIVVTAFLTAGAATPRFEQRLTSFEPWLRRAGGVIFLLAGLNDTLLYWLL